MEGHKASRVPLGPDYLCTPYSFPSFCNNLLRDVFIILLLNVSAYPLHKVFSTQALLLVFVGSVLTKIICKLRTFVHFLNPTIKVQNISPGRQT